MAASTSHSFFISSGAAAAAERIFNHRRGHASAHPENLDGVEPIPSYLVLVLVIENDERSSTSTITKGRAPERAIHLPCFS
jgi:hypothetical protein